MIKSKLSEFKSMQERCSNCSYCKWLPLDKVKSNRFAKNCPSSTYFNFNTYSARGRFQLALALVDGELEYNDTMTQVVHSCTGCGACDVSCKICRYNLEPLEHQIAFKQDAVSSGHVLPEQLKIINSLKNQKTMLSGEVKSSRTKWAEDLKIKNVLENKADILFFPGCKYSYNTQLRGLLKCMVKIMQDAGENFGYLGEADCCCASRAWQMGFADEFTDRANSNISVIESAGIKTIVTPCADCYHGFKRLYAELGLKVEVLHFVEYLDRIISEGKLKLNNTLDITVTYHDPCHLGRQGEAYEAWNGHEKKILNQVHTWEPRRPRYNGSKGIYDAPRRVIQAIPGVKLVEMERIREYSWCCGAGSGCSETLPVYSLATASERVAEARSTNAEILVTACPWCKSNFEADGTMKVIDITELVIASLEGGVL